MADSARSTASSMTETAREKASDVMGQMKGGSDTSSPSPDTSESYSSGTTTGSGSRNGRP
jgi:hypothetical protein